MKWKKNHIQLANLANSTFICTNHTNSITVFFSFSNTMYSKNELLASKKSARKLEKDERTCEKRRVQIQTKAEL